MVRELANKWISQEIKNATFMIDNAPAYSRLEEIEKECPNVNILRLAPYSYLMNNPIELVLSALNKLERCNNNPNLV